MTNLRIARVVPDVAGIEGEFDYKIPAKFDALVEVGTIVRVNFHHRRVRAWVIDADSTPPPGKMLLEIEHVTGAGPDQELIDLAGWAAWRYAGKRSFFLQTASPPRAIRTLNRRRGWFGLPEMPNQPRLEYLRVPPAQSPWPEVLAAGEAGPTLLITPTQRSADGWVKRLRTEGKRVAHYPDDWQQAAEGAAEFVVGTRAAAWAPMPTMAGVVIVDAHDEGLQSEASPTWNAVDVVTERARRRGVACTLISSVPRVTQLRDRELKAPSRDQERHGWAPIVVLDRRGSDPRSGLYSDEVVKLLRSEKRVACVLNRKGRAQLLVCVRCGEMARCPDCDGAQAQGDEVLVCSRCHHQQPVVCTHCGSGKFKQLRQGVQRVREDMETLALRKVDEITGDTDGAGDAQVVIGTEAVLYRIQHTDAVVFMDFDQELLMPRYRAPEDALLLLARASRLVGGRKGDGIVMVQTRQPDHEVVRAAVNSNPAEFTDEEVVRRKEMNWPPNTVLARISGTAAPTYVEKLDGVDVLSLDGKAWLVQAPAHQQLCDALAAVKRPKSGTLRIEVDPSRV